MDEKALEQIGQELDKRIEKSNGQLKDSIDGIDKSVKGEIATLTQKYNEAQDLTRKQQEQLDDISVKLGRGDLSGKALNETFTSLFTKSYKAQEDKIKAVKESMSGRLDFDMDMKAVMETTSLTGEVIAPDRRPGIIMPMERRRHVRELLFRGTTTSSDKWDYTQETSYTDATATVAEGAAIPKSDMTMEQKRADVKKIAAAMDLSNEILEDIPGLLGYVQGRLKSKYDYKEDNQLLFGSGTGTDIRGVYTGATAFAAGTIKPTNNANYMDVLAVAATQMAINEYAATAAVISVQDMTMMALTKNANGDYVLPIIFMAGTASERVMNVIILPTTAMAQNNFLVGDFVNASEIVDRRLVNIAISNENKDNFDRDMVTIRLTSRLALPIYYPQGFVKGTFTAGVTALSA
jgi:HK97 family phage major capsid protein